MPILKINAPRSINYPGKSNQNQHRSGQQLLTGFFVLRITQTTAGNHLLFLQEGMEYE